MALDILVVDDEQDIRELVAGVLEDEGYDTRAAADSDDGEGSCCGFLRLLPPLFLIQARE